jgi:hypothetical protein
MFIGCKSKHKIPYHQEKQRLFAEKSLLPVFWLLVAILMTASSHTLE